MFSQNLAKLRPSREVRATIPWYGIQVRSPKGRSEDYLWKDNLPYDGSIEKHVQGMASVLSLLYLIRQVKPIVGPPVDFSQTEYIKKMRLLDAKTHIGLYFDANRSDLLKQSNIFKGLPNPQQIMMNHSKAWEQSMNYFMMVLDAYKP